MVLERDRLELGRSFLENGGAFILDSVDNKSDIVGHCVKGGKDFHSSYTCYVAKEHAKGNVHLVVKFRASPDPEEFDFVFRRVPTGISELEAAVNNCFFHVGAVPKSSRADWDNYAMRIGVPYLVQGPKGVIPSLVWVERRKQRADFRWVSPQSFPVKFASDTSGVFGKREASIVGVGVAGKSDRSCESSMVERVSEVASGVLYDDADFPRKFGGKADLVDFLSSLRVEVDDFGVRLLLEEGFHTFPGILNLVPRVAD